MATYLRRRTHFVLISILAMLALFAGALLVSRPSSARAADPPPNKHAAELSGAVEYAKNQIGPESPAAGPRVATVTTAAGHNIQVNQDRSTFPHDETMIAVNPTNPNNLIAGANDYRLGYGDSGFYTSHDGGKSWYDGIIPIPSWLSGDVPAGGGDPVVVFDRSGTAYYVGLAFDRGTDRSALVVSRSNNEGDTWSRPSFVSRDGVVAANFGADGKPDPSEFHDKEWAAVDLTSGKANSHPNRIYVTWTLFQGPPRFTPASPIFESHSDDGARTWSPKHEINSSSVLCDYQNSPPQRERCADNQPSWPVVGPDGTVYVFFRNVDTVAENQFLLVRSTDGGATFSDPIKVADDFDINYPTPGTTRPDCLAAGQGRTRRVLSNSCFRVNSYGGPAVAPDGTLYLVWSDNRNGSPDASKTDIFMVRSSDGGDTWSDSIRVNTDPVGNDHFFPWPAVASDGGLYVVFHDRREDPGNKLVGTWLAKSSDRGDTWTDARVTDQSSNWDFGFRNGLFMGDYNGLAVSDAAAYPFFSDARRGTASARRSDVFIDLVNR